MPLVFVHGVNVRYDPRNAPDVVLRNALFRSYAMPAFGARTNSSRIFNPYWGDLGAAVDPREVLPDAEWDAYESFAADDGWSASSLIDDGSGEPDPDCVLVRIAQSSLSDAVDALWEAARPPDEDSADALATRAVTVSRYVSATPAPSWVHEVDSDDAFVARLLLEATNFGSEPSSRDARSDDEIEEFSGSGALDALRAARQRIADAVRSAHDTVAGGAQTLRNRARLAIRRPIQLNFTRFIGDVLVYFNQRERNRRDIATLVGQAFTEAVAEKQRTGEPLIIVAHSMGGIITYDLLTSTHASVPVDCLVTVGSQVAVLERLNMFAASARQARVSRPPNVQRWMNVFDPNDFLGFAAQKVFDGVTDHPFATHSVWAHGGYFRQPMFHERLGARLREQP